MQQGVRIDKWLWAVRIFKTRTMAAAVCHKGRISINDVDVKASRIVKPGDRIIVFKPPVRYCYLVTAITGQRLPAREAVLYYTDETPEQEKEKINQKCFTVYRDKGAGRPTKKDRRTIERFINQ